jgi:hypothetical protein
VTNPEEASSPCPNDSIRWKQSPERNSISAKTFPGNRDPAKVPLCAIERAVSSRAIVHYIVVAFYITVIRCICAARSVSDWNILLNGGSSCLGLVFGLEYRPSASRMASFTFRVNVLT